MGEEGPHDASFGLLLPFDTDNAEFCRGFEAGRLWEILKAEAGEVTEFVHVKNAEMVLRLAEATGRTAQSEEHGQGWLEVTFTEAEEAEHEA